MPAARWIQFPGTQFFARNIAEDGPAQDTWDNTTDVITTQLLGFKSECVSCHNGRGYLDKINVWLTRKTPLGLLADVLLSLAYQLPALER